MGKAAGSPQAPTKASTIVTLVLATLAAAGGGGVAGWRIFGEAGGGKEAQGARPEAHETAKERRKTMYDLPPIVTNLAAPANTWVRLQASVLFDDSQPPEIDALVKRISGDLLAYLQSLTLQQIAGPSGLQHLREDLAERAVIRSDNHVVELVVETLVVQ